MLVEIGDKRYTVTAKMRDWRHMQKAVTRLQKERQNTEDEVAAAMMADKQVDIPMDYINRHTPTRHGKSPEGEWAEDEEWGLAHLQYLEDVAAWEKACQEWNASDDPDKGERPEHPDGPADTLLEPQEAMKLIGEVASPSDVPFA